MINIQDILSTIREKLSTLGSHAAGIVENFMTHDESIAPFSEIRGVDFQAYLSDFEAEQIPAAFSAFKESLIACLDDQTYVGPSGQVFNFVVQQVSDHVWELRDTNSDTEIIQWGYNELEELPFYHFTEAFPDDFSNLGDIVSNMADGISKNDVMLKATDLALKGDLTVSSFIASVNEYISGASSSLKLTIDRIRTGIASSDSKAAASSLIATLQDMFRGSNNPTYNALTHKIEFEDTSFRVSTCLFSSIQTVIDGVSRIISTALAFVNPILSVATGLVSAAYDRFIEWYNSNSDSAFHFEPAESRDNDCFGVPFIQRTIQWANVPQQYQELIGKFGLVKLSHGLFTAYLWQDPSDGNMKCEVFANACSDIRYNEPEVSDLLFNQTQNFTECYPLGNLNNNITEMLDSGNASFFTFEAYALNVKRWLDSTLMPGGKAESYDSPRFSWDGKSQLAARRLRDTFKVFTMLLAGLKGLNSVNWSQQHTAELLVRAEATHSFTSDFTTLARMCAWMNYFEQHQDPFPTEASVYGIYLHSDVSQNTFFKGDRCCTAGLVNYGLPILRDQFNDLTDAEFLPFLTFWTARHTEFTSSANDLGIGSDMIISSAVCNKGNSYVMPPKSAFSVFWRYAATGIVIAAVSAAAVLTFITVKRKLNYAAEKARLRTDKAYEDFTANPTMANYKKYRTRARRYNWYWGKLNGTTYDTGNQWVEAKGNNDLSISGTAILYSKVTGEQSPL